MKSTQITVKSKVCRCKGYFNWQYLLNEAVTICLGIEREGRLLPGLNVI